MNFGEIRLLGLEENTPKEIQKNVLITLFPVGQEYLANFNFIRMFGQSINTASRNA